MGGTLFRVYAIWVLALTAPSLWSLDLKPSGLKITRVLHHPRAQFERTSFLEWQESGRIHRLPALKGCDDILSRAVPAIDDKLREWATHQKTAIFVIQEFGRNSQGAVEVGPAFFSSTSGQAWDLYSGKIERRPLPGLQNSFRQTEYPSIFEWATAYQSLGRSARASISLAAVLNLQEIMAMRADPEQAWVAIQLSSPEQFIEMKKIFRHSSLWQDPLHSEVQRLMVPLLEVLNAFPPHQFSLQFAKLAEITRFQLSDYEMAKILFRLAQTDAVHFDVLPSLWQIVDRPLVVHDATPMSSEKKLLQLRSWLSLFSPRYHDLSFYMAQRQRSLPEWNLRHYSDLSVSSAASDFFREHNAVEISNLEVTRTSDVQDYIQHLLINLALEYGRRHGREQGRTNQIMWGLHKLRQLKLRLGVTTMNPRLQQQLHLLSPFASSAAQPDGAQSFVFDLEQIQDWILADAALRERSLRARPLLENGAPLTWVSSGRMATEPLSLRQMRWSQWQDLNNTEIF